jgi:hypothetical protein
MESNPPALQHTNIFCEKHNETRATGVVTVQGGAKWFKMVQLTIDWHGISM